MSWKLSTTIELDERYFTKKDLTMAVVNKLISEGNTCEYINQDHILLNGEEYTIKEKNYANPVPVQQAILTKL